MKKLTHPWWRSKQPDPKMVTGTDQQIGASFDRFVRVISAVLILVSSSKAHF